MKASVLFFLVVCTVSSYLGEGSKSVQDQTFLGDSETTDNAEQSGLKERSSSDVNGMIMLELFKMVRDMNKVKEMVEKQREAMEFMKGETDSFREIVENLGEELELLKVEVHKLEDRQTSEIDALKTDTTNLQTNLADRDAFIMSQVCETSSVKLPSSCTSGECCLKHTLDSIYRCLPVCGKCPKGYVSYTHGRLCYKIHTSCATWKNARKVCQTEGGDLIVFPDRDTYTFFKNLPNKPYNSYLCRNDHKWYGHWVGLTDTGKEGEWRWIDGSLAGPEVAWYPEQPNNAGGMEHYAGIMRNVGMFNDYKSGHQLSFICAVQ